MIFRTDIYKAEINQVLLILNQEIEANHEAPNRKIRDRTHERSLNEVFQDTAYQQWQEHGTYHAPQEGQIR